MRKVWIGGICAAALTAGCAFLYACTAQERFDQLSKEFFRHELAADTITLHYTLADPKAYRITETAASLGGSDPRESDYLQHVKDRLDRCLPQLQSSEELMTARVMDWWLEGQLAQADLFYYQEPVSPVLGIQAQLPILLAEFPFRSQRDIDLYLELLDLLPDYFRRLTSFEQEKAARGLFMCKEALEEVLSQCRSAASSPEEHFLITGFADRLQACGFLTSNQRIAYEVRNRRAVREFVIPAYEALAASLELLRGAGSNACGLSYYEDGLAYYQYLLTYSVGTDLSFAEIRALLEDQIATDYETVLYAVQQGEDLLDTDLPDASWEEILEGLRQAVLADFPDRSPGSCRIKEAPASLRAYLSPAFYLTPPIDAAEEPTIYINPAYNQEPIDRITALAHEGYPGHLYQNTFEASLPAVRSLFYVGGYTEGWGLYSELYAYHFLGYSDVKADALCALSSLNYAVCASLDLLIHTEGWTESDCASYLEAFGVSDAGQLHRLYLDILEEPSNYLKYYLGYLEIQRLKEDYLASSSSRTLFDFHQWFLELGPAPFPILREFLPSGA